jgi:hypothetical protein
LRKKRKYSSPGEEREKEEYNLHGGKVGKGLDSQVAVSLSSLCEEKISADNLQTVY